jgi:hypothetical protein
MFEVYFLLSLIPNAFFHKTHSKFNFPSIPFADKLSERNVAGMEFCAVNCVVWEQYPF